MCRDFYKTMVLYIKYCYPKLDLSAYKFTLKIIYLLQGVTAHWYDFTSDRVEARRGFLILWATDEDIIFSFY